MTRYALGIFIVVNSYALELFQDVIVDPGGNAGDMFGSAIAQAADGPTFAISSIRAGGSVYVCTAVNLSTDGDPCGQVLRAGPVPVGGTFGASLAISADGSFLAVTSGSNGIFAGLSTFRCANANCTPWQTFTLQDGGGSIVALSGNGAMLATPLIWSGTRRTLQNIIPLGPIPSPAARITGLTVVVYMCSSTECIMSDIISTQATVSSLAFSQNGSVLAVGALYANLSGTVTTYSCLGGLCSSQQIIASPGGIDAYQDHFGSAVAWSASGGALVVSAVGRNAGVGAVMLYSCSQAICTVNQVVVPEANDDVKAFGCSVSMSEGGDRVAVGASSYGGGPGAVFLLMCMNGACGNPQIVMPSPSWIGSNFGLNVALSGDGSAILSGAPGVAGSMGVAYRFEQLAQSMSASTLPSATTTRSPVSSATPSASAPSGGTSPGNAPGPGGLSVGGLVGIFVAAIICVAATASGVTWCLLSGKCARRRGAGESSLSFLERGAVSERGSLQAARAPALARHEVSAGSASTTSGTNLSAAVRQAFVESAARGVGQAVDAGSWVARSMTEHLLPADPEPN